MEIGESVTLLLAVCISSLVLLSAWRQIVRIRNLPPGPFPLPVLGNLLELKANKMLLSFKKLSEKYGPVYTVHLGPRRVVVLYGFAAVKEALVDHAEEFSGRGLLATVDDFVKGLGVAFANGERWRQLRRFSLSTLRNFGMGKRSIEERIQEEAQCLLEEFRKTKGEPFDPTFFLSRSVSNVICSIVFGQRFEYEDQQFLDLMHETSVPPLTCTIPLQMYEMFSWIMKYLPGPHVRMFQNLQDIYDFIEKRIKINQESLDPANPRDYIDCFLVQMEKIANPSSEFHFKTLIMTALNLFIAGTETVSSTLRYGLLILMKYPDVQAKVVREIDEVIGQNRLPSAEDRSRMPYTDAVIHEIQRFSDVIPMSLTHAVTQDTQFRGYTIPKGTDVVPLLTSALRDPSCFNEPEKFNPSHFLDEQGHFKKNDAFIPFSTGKRVCAGEGLARMELFVFFTCILQNFVVKSPVAPSDIDLTPPVSGFANIPPPYKLCAIPR
uniref:Cytochrome P450 family 2 subfamily G member 59 n=1 Tax=Sphenodon punctatus TaxID=8508 RepID=A0A8D0L9U0_SPHPU